MNSGLGSISKIPTGLRTLIDAQKALRQEAAPVTPQGTPTVAGQVEQAIAQRMQQQAPQPQGLPGMMPNDPFREQLMKTLQAQAQMQGQPQQPQQPQDSGIAQLPAPNMQNMREGGVVGYFGGDYVDDYEADDEYGEAAPADQGGGAPVAYDPAQDIEREKALLLKRSQALNAQPATQLTPSQQIMEMIKETRGRIRQVEEAEPPTAYTKEQAYKEAEAAVPFKPWEERRKGIEQLVKKQEAILNRGQQLYDQEKSGRRDELIQAFLGSKGAGAGGRAVAEMQNIHQSRDQQFTNQLIKDFDYTKSLLDLSNSANQDEFKYNLDKTLGKVDDYQKAVDLFKSDRTVRAQALRGELGPLLQSYARTYSSEQRAGKMTDTESYAQGYLEDRLSKGDTRPEEVILQEGRNIRLAAQQAAAHARVGVAGRAIDQNILNEASKAASKAIADAEAKPGSALARELRDARKDPNARARIKDRLYREELRNRGVDPNQVPGPAPEIPTAAPTAAPTTSTGAKRYKLDELPNQPK
jgi:hypothetical protein